MIISRTPMRISFAGGGTDLDAFYRREPGAVFSTAIDKYMYVTVNRYFDERIILKYSKTEEVRRVADIRHPLLRECLRLTGVSSGVEITSMADIVGGTGLGSSSSFTVGVLHALHRYKGESVCAEQLAREACEVEIGRVGEPIGKQDQYIAAYGGLRFFEFMPDEQVRSDPVIGPSGQADELFKRLLLFYTGKTRKASTILRRARARYDERREELRALRGLADRAGDAVRLGRTEEIGRLLHEGWELKKSLASGITNPAIDRAYEAARRAGAAGGKILGAGGGGFLLVFAEPQARDRVRRALKGLREIPVGFEPEGSRILYAS